MSTDNHHRASRPLKRPSPRISGVSKGKASCANKRVRFCKSPTPSTSTYVEAADANADTNLDLNQSRRLTRNRTQPRRLPSKPRKLPPSTHTPKTASEKAIFRRNATESPLLRLPSEIRNRIWVFILGERMLHVRREIMHHGNADGAMRKGVVLRATECACPFTERALFERYLALLGTMAELENVAEEKKEEESEGFADLQPFGLYYEDSQAFNLDFSTLGNPDVLENFDFDSFLNQGGTDDFNFDGFGSGCCELPSPSYFALPDSLSTLSLKIQKQRLRDALNENPHATCFPMYFGDLAYQSQSQSGSSWGLRQVCRQVYGETKAVFWSTNTFSFECPNDFFYFMKARPLLVRNMITKLHLGLDHGMLWGMQLSSRPEIRLEGLKELHLSGSAPEAWNLKGCESKIFESLGVWRGRGLRDVTIVAGLPGNGRDIVGEGYKERIKITKRMRAELMGSGPIAL